MVMINENYLSRVILRPLYLIQYHFEINIIGFMCYKVFISFFSEVFIFKVFRYIELIFLIKPFFVNAPLYLHSSNGWHEAG